MVARSPRTLARVIEAPGRRGRRACVSLAFVHYIRCRLRPNICACTRADNSRVLKGPTTRVRARGTDPYSSLGLRTHVDVSTTPFSFDPRGSGSRQWRGCGPRPPPAPAPSPSLCPLSSAIIHRSRSVGLWRRRRRGGRRSGDGRSWGRRPSTVHERLNHLLSLHALL